MSVTRRALSRLAALTVVVCTGGPAPALDLVAYVPDYRMDESHFVNTILPKQLALIEEVRYFGITVTNSGGLTTNAGHLADLTTLRNLIDALPESQRPRLVVALGGAGISDSFDNVAASTTATNNLAGNINSLLSQVGAVGIDFDWEHPDEGDELLVDYPAMLDTVKQVLGNDRVYATVAPSKILPHSVFEGPNAIDGASLMTYDLGWWANDPSDPNLGEHSLPVYAEDALEAWTNPAGTPIPRTWVFGSKTSIDAPEDHLAIGIPFYGRGYAGSGGAYTYIDLHQNGTTADGNYYNYFGSNVWMLGPDLVAERIEYANQQGLQNVIIWELGQDLDPDDPDSLLRAAYEANLAFQLIPGDADRDGDVDLDDFDILTENFGQAVVGGTLQGDFNEDGFVTFDDFAIQALHFGQSNGESVHAPVPEPASVTLLAACSALAFVPGRRMRQQYSCGQST